MRIIIYLILATALVGCTLQKKTPTDNFDFGKTEVGSYENNYFDLKVLFNPDWIIQDKKEMNDLVESGVDIIAGEDESIRNIMKAAQVNTAYLLTIFKYEVGAAVDFNPSFMVISENLKSFPGVKNGSDYLFHAKKLLTQTQLNYYFEKETYEKKVGESIFHVLEAKIDYLGVTIIQEYYSTVTKGFSLSFIVSYTTDAERDELYEIIDKISI